MIGQQAVWFRWSDSRNDALEMLATAQPDRWAVKLLRSFAPPGLKLLGDVRQQLPSLVEIGMLAGQRDRGLARMLGSSAHRGHQPRPTGDGLAPGFQLTQVGQPDLQFAQLRIVQAVGGLYGNGQ